jgi:uncharacterized protein YndB with AHSA1/START domain
MNAPDLSVDREISISRVYDAPRSLVFQMFADCRHLANWWGPRGFSLTTHAMDFRVGGVWRFVMHGPDGRDYDNVINYTEIRPNELIAWRHGGDRAGAGPVDFTVTVRFAEAPGGKTRMDWKMVFASNAVRDMLIRENGADEGAVGTTTRLEEALLEAQADADEAFMLTRTFKAPRERVFEAWTKADHLMKWFGPVGFPLCHSEPDLSPGAVYLYGMRSANGQEMWGRWVVREVIPPRSIVFVQSFSDPQRNITRAPFSNDWPLEVLTTIRFEEPSPGQTTIVMRSLPLNASPAERAMFKSMHASMTGGWGGTLKQLEAFLAP